MAPTARPTMRGGLTGGVRLVLLLLLTVAGCRCGPELASVQVSAGGALLVRSGELGPLAEGTRLWIRAGDGGADLGELLIGAPGADEGSYEARLRCAASGGVPEGLHGLRRVPAGPWPCERWGRIVGAEGNLVELDPGLRPDAGSLFRVDRHAEGAAESTTVWGRLAPPDASLPGRRSFELLLPVDAPALPPGTRVDLSLPAAGDLHALLARDALRASEEALTTAREAFLAALDSETEQRAVAHLYEFADRVAARAAELAPAAEGEEGDSLPQTVWTSWLSGLTQRLERAREAGATRWPVAARTARSHRPRLTARAKGDAARTEDLARLDALLESGAPVARATEPRPRRDSERPARRRRKPAAPKEAEPEPRFEYVALAELPEEVRDQYRYIRAIPVNLDPSRFADRSAEELREEQVVPLLTHAARYLSTAGDVAREEKRAPAPELTCRVLFALDNVKRGQKVYRSTQEDLTRAATLSRGISKELLDRGRKECFRMMRKESY